MHGAGGTPPSPKTHSLPHLATPPFSVRFVVEASVRNIPVRKNRVEHCASYACSLRSSEVHRYASQAALAGGFADSRHKEETQKMLHPWGKRSTWWKDRE